MVTAFATISCASVQAFNLPSVHAAGSAVFSHTFRPPRNTRHPFFEKQTQGSYDFSHSRQRGTQPVHGLEKLFRSGLGMPQFRQTLQAYGIMLHTPL